MRNRRLRIPNQISTWLSHEQCFGVASGALALEFNRMAAGIYDAMPGIGIFFGFLVLLLGHTVNLVLGLASAVIHGLRLNVIEFFNWGLKETRS